VAAISKATASTPAPAGGVTGREQPPTRPVLRYHGGKWRLAPWLLGFFPPHRIYVEPFGGGASVLVRKPRAYGEVYNDLDRGVVNLFRVLRDPAMAAELRRRLELTPFAREEFKAAYRETSDPIELAWCMVVRAFMGFGSASMTRNHVTGFRSNSNRRGTTTAQDWANWPACSLAITGRLQGVVIENRPAVEVIAQHDRATTLHYVDPPYPLSTRSAIRWGCEHFYAHEMTDADHRALAAVLHRVEGMVVLSGYACALYDEELYPDWRRETRKHFADSARERTEVVWMNPACAAALDRVQGRLF
jgi:DNA adenine methylase